MLWSLGFVIPGFLGWRQLSVGRDSPWAGSSAWSSYFNACFKWAPVITWATDINTDLSCGRIMGPDVASSSSWSLDVTMAQGSSANLSDPQRPSSSVVPGLQHGPRWWSRPWAVTWPSTVTGAVDLNTDPGCGRPCKQTWPLATVQAWMLILPRCQLRPSQSVWFWQQCDPWAPTRT